MKINLQSKTLVLKANADVSHEDAEEMYACYGAYLTDDETGEQIEIQAVEIEWLRAGLDVEEIAEKLGGGDVAKNLAELAKRVWRDMVAIEDALAEAVEAYAEEDIEGVVSALRTARSLESDHGDDPSSAALAEQLLVDLKMTIPEARAMILATADIVQERDTIDLADSLRDLADSLDVPLPKDHVASAQIGIRTTSHRKNAYVQKAQKEGKTLSEGIIAALDAWAGYRPPPSA